jgi:hypothetical protein
MMLVWSDVALTRPVPAVVRPLHQLTGGGLCSRTPVDPTAEMLA